jgi:acetolactate synthase-1/2/3 large subunit
VILILRDDAFGMIRWKQENMNFPDYGMTLRNPDFVAYAQSYGAIGHRVESAADFAPLLRECFATPGVHVIDVPIDYSDNERVLNREIKRLSAQL